MRVRGPFGAVLATAIAGLALVGVFVLRTDRSDWRLLSRDAADLPAVSGGWPLPGAEAEGWILRVEPDGSLRWGGHPVSSAQRDAGLREGLHAAVARMEVRPGGLPDGVLWLDAHRHTPAREVARILAACTAPPVQIWKIHILVCRAHGRPGQVRAYLSGEAVDEAQERGPGDVTLLVGEGVARFHSDAHAFVEVTLHAGTARVRSDPTARVCVDPGASSSWARVLELVETLAVDPERVIRVGDVPVQFYLDEV